MMSVLTTIATDITLATSNPVKYTHNTTAEIKVFCTVSRLVLSVFKKDSQRFS